MAYVLGIRFLHFTSHSVVSSTPLFIKRLLDPLDAVNRRRIMLSLFVVSWGKFEPDSFYRLVVTEMLFENLVSIVRLNPSIPDALRIDDDDGAVAAMVKTTGTVDADGVSQAGFGYASLKTPEQAIRVAIEPAVRTVCADKDMFFIL
jgi:hypothetical protein